MIRYLSGLFVYPVKSCKGIALQQVQVDSMGPSWDRRWMIVDMNGRFITQRKYPKLALIDTKVTKEHLQLTIPHVPPFYLPLKNGGGEELRVEVWNDFCRAIDQGDAVNKALSQYLEVECRLVFLPEDSIRPVDPKYARKESDHVSFADGFPFLVISEASLQDLNSRLETAVPMNRFRPNLVVSGCEPYEEDTWKAIKIGDLHFDLVKPCARCVVTTVDQSTGVKGLEPLQTLATYRKREKGIMFGQNAIHSNQGMLKVGDQIEVLKS